MEIKNKTNAVAYTAPECKAVEVELQGMICTSNEGVNPLNNLGWEDDE